MKAAILLPGMRISFLYYRATQGLGIQLNRAVFVKEIHPETNEVILAPLKSLEKSEMWLKDWNIVNESRLLGYDDIIVRIRYRKQENHCSVTITPEDYYIYNYTNLCPPLQKDKQPLSIRMVCCWEEDYNDE